MSMAKRSTRAKKRTRTRIRRDDIVQVIAGKGGAGLKRRLAEGEDAKDRQARGKVLSVDPEKGRALVQGIKMVTKSQRARGQDQQQPRERFIEKESPIVLSNLMLVCPACDEATRIGIRLEKHEHEDGRVKDRRIRVCKRCGKDIPERS